MSGAGVPTEYSMGGALDQYLPGFSQNAPAGGQPQQGNPLLEYLRQQQQQQMLAAMMRQFQGQGQRNQGQPVPQMQPQRAPMAAQMPFPMMFPLPYQQNRDRDQNNIIPALSMLGRY